MKPRLWDRYEPAVRCTEGDRPGASALMAWALGEYPHATNSGIYACRPVDGGSTLSVHSEGRALDIGCGQPGQWAQRLADDLVWRSRGLQVQCVIYNRQEWAADHADEGWRPYLGDNDHTDHLHVELSRWSANTLTEARVAQVMAGGGATTHLETEAIDPDPRARPRSDPFERTPPGHGPHCRCPYGMAGHRSTGVVAADVAGVGTADVAVPRRGARSLVVGACCG